MKRMKFRHSIPVAVAALALLATTTGCKHLESRDQLVKGIQAFKSAHYEEAIDHFQKSIDLDPAEATPRLYLATAYAQLVVPNLDTPENLKTASRAKQAFQDVLARNPDDITSLKRPMLPTPTRNPPTTPSASLTGPRNTKTQCKSSPTTA
jgi:tetratricopeptide (TPR) repeat protein